MKFAIVVLAAVAVCVQSSVIAPLAYSYANTLPYGAPLAYHSYGAPLAYAAPIHASVAYHQAPIAAPIVYSAPVVAAYRQEPTYTAINRGAIHTAPLPGHSESTSAVNLEPAPGTL